MSEEERIAEVTHSTNGYVVKTTYHVEGTKKLYKVTCPDQSVVECKTDKCTGEYDNI